MSELHEILNFTIVRNYYYLRLIHRLKQPMDVSGVMRGTTIMEINNLDNGEKRHHSKKSILIKNYFTYFKKKITCFKQE